MCVGGGGGAGGGRLQQRIQIQLSRKNFFSILFELISLTHYCIYHMYVSVSNKILFKLKRPYRAENAVKEYDFK